ncbi:MAG: hypothetical protein MI919_17475, partial [Holophagales bacterium]|nr:hypothetical protein [Holophagales bacterium]
VAQGFSRVREGVCEMSGDPSAARIPRSIETLVVSTLDSLRPAEQLMLKVCSVVGGLFTAELLEEIYPVSATREELLSSLATLEQLRLLVRATPEPDVSYRFRHRITRDVAYELLLHSRRRHLHRSIAEWYERRHAGGLDPYYPVLASHWWRALQEVELAEPWLVTKAIDCLSEAGEQALREDSFVDAADSARRGLGLLGSLPRSLERARLELALRLVQDAAARGLGHQDEPEAVRNDARILELRHQLEQSGPVPIGRLVRRPESQE